MSFDIRVDIPILERFTTTSRRTLGNDLRPLLLQFPLSNLKEEEKEKKELSYYIVFTDHTGSSFHLTTFSFNSCVLKPIKGFILKTQKIKITIIKN
jgi:hypothetical protein